MSNPAPNMPRHLITLSALSEFNTRIDARSPDEFQLDHVPNAISCPVLSNEQRQEIGTIYKHVSPFAAKVKGATYVARNIAEHIEQRFSQYPKQWRPLVYCWRGGKRSGALVTILREIGWEAYQLAGGYKAWRRQVISDMASIPHQFKFIVITGSTGSGKSRLLEALRQNGAQTLHLEELAKHRGSLLGQIPGQSQPSQRLFESQLHCNLLSWDKQRPVFVEAESRRVGQLHIPETLINNMRHSTCLQINAGLEARAEFLLKDYPHLQTQHARLNQLLQQLQKYHDHATAKKWKQLATIGRHKQLALELLEKHYDPLYARSLKKNYQHYQSAPPQYDMDNLSQKEFQQLAKKIIEDYSGLFPR